MLAIDIGAESGRGVVGTIDDDRLHLAEVYRFANTPVRLGGTLHWDFLRIFGDVGEAIGRAGDLASVGVDTWGVDYGLLDQRGRLIANPVHYRDTRTAGAIDRVTQVVARETIYERTGIQFLEINTLYQLFAQAQADELQHAERLLLMPDLISHFLCGSETVEYTNATTTQCFDAKRQQWAFEILEPLGIPARLFPQVVQPGTILGTFGDGRTRVVAPATHDTGSAVAAMPLARDGSMAFLSSGTWSLLGIEVPAPIVNRQALAANVTNEGGVAGTTRLLKNVMGLWLVQEARRGARESLTYDELTAMAAQAPSGTAYVDPDDVRFLRPTDMPSLVREYCRETAQPEPPDLGTLVRVLLESLALKYAIVLDELKGLTGRQIEAIYVVGGGARNELLCRLTASATGLPVLTGPTEATAVGNVLVQAVALGELASVAEGRELVARSFPARCYEPEEDWSVARERFARLLDTGVSKL